MCLSDQRRDYSIEVETSGAGPYSTEIELGKGVYGLPFEVSEAWISAIWTAEPCTVEIRRVTATGPSIMGTQRAPVGNLSVPIGSIADLHITASGAELTAAPTIIFTLSTRIS